VQVKAGEPARVNTEPRVLDAAEPAIAEATGWAYFSTVEAMCGLSHLLPGVSGSPRYLEPSEQP
jgi:hypothetical protein